MNELFEEQVARSPDAIALICEGSRLTYRELNERADQLAYHLRELGVKAETLVGICTSRSPDMVVAMFAVFKAGGAYVPLDPSYPQERLSFILKDAQMTVVITQVAHLALFSEQTVHAVCLDGDWQQNTRLSAAQDAMVSPENLAYVIYTSGSTGNPKGVMITHSSLSHFVRLAGSALDVGCNDVYLQTASMSYALSVRQLMIPLANGATVVLANAEEMRDPLLMFQLIKRERITLIDFVPSFWRACIQRLSDLPSNERKDLLDNSLRRIVSIGEPLMFDLPHDWFYEFGHKAQLVNIFGQTETTGVVATYPIPRETPAKTGIVPIGHSITRTRLYILDANLQPVPVGEPGELCVSNPCLARGYLNRPELTAEKFILNPFQDGLNSHLYRTGDMALQREDGNIEFLGRGDQQVKIRGQRIELGEIESVLRRHESVRECVAMVRGDHPDNKYLAAYIVARDDSVSASELREFARSYLAETMIPSTFVFLDEMPIMPNGKLNRLALPDPSTLDSRELSARSNEGPLSSVEQTIANIWMELMSLERVGIHEDFFDLGGHSLTVVRLFSRIDDEFGVRLPATIILQAPTIAQLAHLITNVNEDITQWKTVVPVRPNGNKPPFFGVHAIDGSVLFWRDIVSCLPKNQPFFAFQAQGVDGIQTPLDSIPKMATLYISEMRNIQPHGPYYMGGYSLGGEIVFEMAQQLVNLGEKVNLLVLFDTLNPTRTIRPTIHDADGALLPEFDPARLTDIRHIAKRKLIGHYYRLSRLDPKKRIDYLHYQIEFRLNRLWTAVLVKIFHTLRLPLPSFLRLRYLQKEHSEALANYVPSVYPGKITLFRSNHTLQTHPIDSPMGWRPLAGGGLDVFYFDAPHMIVNAPYAKEVARKLDECLQAARGEVPP